MLFSHPLFIFCSIFFFLQLGGWSNQVSSLQFFDYFQEASEGQDLFASYWWFSMAISSVFGHQIFVSSESRFNFLLRSFTSATLPFPLTSKACRPIVNSRVNGYVVLFVSIRFSRCVLDIFWCCYASSLHLSGYIWIWTKHGYRTNWVFLCRCRIVSLSLLGEDQISSSLL